jgi:catechol 2,3-dioxygenase-like lactoylglutathione lyase family enzyme
MPIEINLSKLNQLYLNDYTEGANCTPRRTSGVTAMQKPTENIRLSPRKVHHTAYVTYDAVATVDFYTRVMGLEFCSAVMDSRLPSTGEPLPYFHIFFRLGDGSTVAFFECPGVPRREPSPHIADRVFNHLALEVGSREEVDRWRDWLVSQGVEAIGPVDHGIIYSVYFFDNNGLRSEITTTLDPGWNQQPQEARRQLDLWTKIKDGAISSGRDASEALFEAIEASGEKHAK